jgi:hypothetical protein
VKEETAHKLLRSKRHDLAFIMVGIGAVLEKNSAVFDLDESVIGDGDPMSVLAQIFDDLFRSGEGFFRIDDPVLSGSLFEKRLESRGPREFLDFPLESEGVVTFFKCLEKLSAKDLGEYFYRE